MNIEEVKRLDDEERIRFIQRDRFVKYPRAKRILDRLEDLLKYPDTLRPPSFMIVGDPNNGKTALALYFLRNNLPYERESGEIVYPVVFVQAPEKPDLSRFYDYVLDALKIPYRRSAPLSHREALIEQAFEEYSVKLIIIDEIHNVLSGSTLKQREFMNGLKNLTNYTKRPLVLVGTKDALIATDTDAQIASRFKPEYLPLWTYDKDYLSFLNAIEKTLPLKKKSDIALNKQLSGKILELSEGYIGEIVSIVKELAVLAIRSGKEKVDISLLRELGWVAPSGRRNITGLG